MKESKRAYNEIQRVVSEYLEDVTVILVKGDGGQLTIVALGSSEKEDVSQSAPFADGVGMFIHFGVIDTPHERGLIVIDGVTSSESGVGK